MSFWFCETKGVWKFLYRFYGNNFNKIISDFDLLESVYFSIDDINNKDTLSRYNFARAGKQYCLVKLYSFAQAIHGNRIEGSSMGVGILSDYFIDFSEYNLSILRAAKDKFSELSLSGLKFNKPTFSADTDKIWKGLVNSSNGNLISKIDTSRQAKSFENSNQPYGFYLKRLIITLICLRHPKLNVLMRDVTNKK